MALPAALPVQPDRAQPTALRPPVRLHVMTDGCECLHLWEPGAVDCPMAVTV